MSEELETSRAAIGPHETATPVKKNASTSGLSRSQAAKQNQRSNIKARRIHKSRARQNQRIEIRKDGSTRVEGEDDDTSETENTTEVTTEATSSDATEVIKKLKVDYYLDIPVPRATQNNPDQGSEKRFSPGKHFAVTDARALSLAPTISSAALASERPIINAIRTKGTATVHGRFRADTDYYPAYFDLDDGIGNHKVVITLHNTLEAAKKEREKGAKVSYDDFPIRIRVG